MAEAADTSDAAVVESVAADMAGIQSHLADDVALADDVIARVEALERDLVERTLTSSGCRPSTPTTASGSTATVSWCATRPWQPPWVSCCRCSTTSTGPREHGELVGGFRVGGRGAAGSRRQARLAALR